MTKNPLVARGSLAVLTAAASLALSPLATAQTVLPPPLVNNQADARQDRIEELENQLRESTAENERLQYDLIQARREVARLQGMLGELAAANQSLQTAPPAVEGGATPPPAPDANGGGTPAPAPNVQGSLGELPASALPGEAGPAYSRARELLVRGNYAEAEVAFSEFLSAHGDADTAPDARYWFAFTLLARNNFQQAAAGFVDYLQRYPQGPRAPDAHVRLGMALAGMGETRQACTAFRSLTRSYPRAPQPVRELAAREARAHSCQA